MNTEKADKTQVHTEKQNHLKISQPDDRNHKKIKERKWNKE